MSLYLNSLSFFMSILWTFLFLSNFIIICSWKLIGTTQCSTCFYYNRQGGWTPSDWEIPDVKTGGISRRIRCIHQNMYAYQTHERLFVRLSCSNSNREQHLPSALFIPQIIKFPPVVFFIFKFRSCQTPWASRHIWLKVSRPRQKGAERRWRKYLKKMEITVSHAYYETHSRRGERVGVKFDQ
jgi:hypothetical protein